jgi:predicted dinucleotide-binding enzyme
MNIAIIGSGNIGGTLARGWAAKSHRIFLGVRDLADAKVMQLALLDGISAHTVAEAAAQADTILIAAHPSGTEDICKQLGDTSGKLIIDAMNSVSSKAGHFDSTYAAIRHWTKADVVKCFNSTGFENMANPHFGNMAVEMFLAGGSPQGKATTRQLAMDLGFADCIDFGGEDKVALLEQFALIWINLAFAQGQGRGFAFKLMKRN